MEFKRCNRCGNFYVSSGDVCPKCTTKDNFEFSTFTSYIQENGLENPLSTISSQIGVSVKNLNRFVNYEKFEEFKKNYELNNSLKGIKTIENEKES